MKRSDKKRTSTKPVMYRLLLHPRFSQMPEQAEKIPNQAQDGNYYSQGFTLTELLVVVVLIGVLTAIVLPRFHKTLDSVATTEAEQMMAAVRAEQEARCSLDRAYTTDSSKIAALSNAGGNFTYTLEERGMKAEYNSSDMNYTLKMPSYYKGKFCCTGTHCSELNKPYEDCSTMTATYLQDTNCAPQDTLAQMENPNAQGDIEPPSPGDPSDEPGDSSEEPEEGCSGDQPDDEYTGCESGCGSYRSAYYECEGTEWVRKTVEAAAGTCPEKPDEQVVPCYTALNNRYCGPATRQPTCKGGQFVFEGEWDTSRCNDEKSYCGYSACVGECVSSPLHPENPYSYVQPYQYSYACVGSGYTWEWRLQYRDVPCMFSQERCATACGCAGCSGYKVNSYGCMCTGSSRCEAICSHTGTIAHPEIACQDQFGTQSSIGNGYYTSGPSVEGYQRGTDPWEWDARTQDTVNGYDHGWAFFDTPCAGNVNY